MLKIRLKRIGKKHQPSFRVVVQERRSKLKGKFIDDLGFYNPTSKKITIDAEKVKKWIASGAQASGTVHNLLVKNKIVSGAKVNLAKKPKKTAPENAEQKTEGESAQPKSI